MKLLIISGPYEADRLRKAAVSAGFEAVAVEPGESLSGWITASRPALIIMAPQMVHPDPEQALAKVRSVPRGRVPIFLVGDAADDVAIGGFHNGPAAAMIRIAASARRSSRSHHGVRDGVSSRGAMSNNRRVGGK